MESSPYLASIVNKLRGFVHTWLIDIRQSRAIFAEPGFLAPHPDYPLPTGFPYSNTTIQENFRWVDIYGQNQINHGYRIEFAFQGLPSSTNPWAPLVWSISSGLVIVGFVELDARMYYDQDPLLRFDADFILEAMVTSVRVGNRIRVSSRIVLELANPTTGPSTAVSRNLEIFEMCTFGGVLVRELGRRYIHRRSCGLCHRWLPPAGPPHCLTHLTIQSET